MYPTTSHDFGLSTPRLFRPLRPILPSTYSQSFSFKFQPNQRTFKNLFNNPFVVFKMNVILFDFDCHVQIKPSAQILIVYFTLI